MKVNCKNNFLKSQNISKNEKRGKDEEKEVGKGAKVDISKKNLDVRFSTLGDPRFKNLNKKQQKILIDERFSRILKNDDFGKMKLIDPYGRKKFKKKVDELSRLYAISDDKQEEKIKKKSISYENEKKERKEVEDKDKKGKERLSQMELERKKVIKLEDDPHREDSEDEANEDDINIINNDDEEEKEDKTEDKEHASSTEDICSDDQISSSGDDISDDEVEDIDDSIWNRFEDNVPMGNASCRIAVMGLDWSNVSAEDLLVVFRSVTLNGKASSLGSYIDNYHNTGVKKVTIYLSNYGEKQLEKEAIYGPDFGYSKNKTEKKQEEKGDEKGDEKGEEKESEKQEEEQEEYDEDILKSSEEDKIDYNALRNYEKQKTKYYFAIVECESEKIASMIYDELDGLDAQFCLDGLDLRFVPDDLEITQKVFSSASTVSINYEPPKIFNDSMKHSKVKCTWDETPANRTALLRKRFTANELSEMDLKAYLASGSEEEGNNADEECKSNYGTIEEYNLQEYRNKLLGGFANLLSSDDEEKDSGLREKMKKMQKEELSHKKTKNDIEIRFDENLKYLNENYLKTEKSDDNKTEKPKMNSWESFLAKKEKLKKEKKLQRTAIKNNALKKNNNEEDDFLIKPKSAKITSKFPLVLMDNENDLCNLDDQKKKELKNKIADLELLAMHSNEERHFDIRPLKGKQKRRKEEEANETDNFQFNLNDARLSKLFNNPDYALDPTDPKFKSSKVNNEILKAKITQKKLKKMQEQERDTAFN